LGVPSEHRERICAARHMSSRTRRRSLIALSKLPAHLGAELGVSDWRRYRSEVGPPVRMSDRSAAANRRWRAEAEHRRSALYGIASGTSPPCAHASGSRGFDQPGPGRLVLIGSDVGR
jgi:hypothetical protein